MYLQTTDYQLVTSLKMYNILHKKIYYQTLFRIFADTLADHLQSQTRRCVFVATKTAKSRFATKTTCPINWDLKIFATQIFYEKRKKKKQNTIRKD